MKKIVSVISIFILTMGVAFAGGNKEKTPKQSTQNTSARSYTGNGGKGMSLAVLVPSAIGIYADQNYLPTMVQGVLVGDFSKYSAISVLDRQTLEKTLKETESGIYENDAAYGQLGEIANVNYVLTGSIAKTSEGYAMQVQVVGTGKDNIGITIASYSGSCTIAELDNFTGIRKASLELLTQMGVALTDKAKKELSGAATTNQINAQTALAQGIIAQRSGSNTIETMARFYEAASYDPSFAEAAKRLNTISTSIRTGSLGENIRNDIAWRHEWEKTLEDAEAFLRKQTLYVAKISNPSFKIGKVNYKDETVEVTINADISGLPYPQAFTKMLDDLNVGLKATGRMKDWGLDYLSVDKIFAGGRSAYNVLWDSNDYEIDIMAEIIDKGTGRRIGYEVIKLQGPYKGNFYVYIGKESTIVFNGSYDGYYYRGRKLKTFETTITVDAKQITDEMSLRFWAVSDEGFNVHGAINARWETRWNDRGFMEKIRLVPYQ